MFTSTIGTCIQAVVLVARENSLVEINKCKICIFTGDVIMREAIIVIKGKLPICVLPGSYSFHYY